MTQPGHYNNIALQMNNEYFRELAKNYYQLSFIVFLMI